LVDLTPHIALIVADQADHDGNLYTGPNTEDTPTIAEAAAFRGAIVVAQVNTIVDQLPRVDIPGGWVDFVVPSPRPYQIDPLFTRDPAKISVVVSKIGQVVKLGSSTKDGRDDGLTEALFG
jgi:malonate decarboxylase alpha subunit